MQLDIGLLRISREAEPAASERVRLTWQEKMTFSSANGDFGRWVYAVCGDYEANRRSDLEEVYNYIQVSDPLPGGQVVIPMATRFLAEFVITDASSS